MMKEDRHESPYMNTLRFVQTRLIQNTINVQAADAAIYIGRMDLSYPPDKEFYYDLMLSRECLVCIAGNNICLN